MRENRCHSPSFVPKKFLRIRISQGFVEPTAMERTVMSIGKCIGAVVTFPPCESSCATELVTTPATSTAVATRILLREEWEHVDIDAVLYHTIRHWVILAKCCRLGEVFPISRNSTLAGLRVLDGLNPGSSLLGLIF